MDAANESGPRWSGLIELRAYRWLLTVGLGLLIACFGTYQAFATAPNTSRIERLEHDRGEELERLTRLEERLGHVGATVDRIARRLGTH